MTRGAGSLLYRDATAGARTVGNAVHKPTCGSIRDEIKITIGVWMLPAATLDNLLIR